MSNSSMSNSDVAAVLEQTADLIELTDGNPHRARAFARAARTIGDLEDAVEDRLRDGSLTEVSGIGDAMTDHVADILDTGTFPLHDELMNAIPPGLLEVLRVKGLGTKRTRRLWTELEITSLDELEAAAENDRITSLNGFGAKTQRNILENVRQLRSYKSQWRLPDVRSAVDPFLDDLRGLDLVQRAAPTGALRRHVPTLRQATLVVATDAPDALQAWVADRVPVSNADENEHLVATLPDGIPLHLHVVPASRFGTEWWRTTGSADHRAAFEAAHGAPDAHRQEEDVFAAAGLPTIPPELREDRGVLAAAAEGTLPSLLTADDLAGCLHNHSTYSDGSASLADMAEAARALGFTYFGVCDHSQSLRIADGLSPAEVRRQRDEVQALNESYAQDEDGAFRVVHGIESDILGDGTLDYDDEVLSIFDFVLASVHTGFSMSEAEATERVVRAVQNPHTRILGHPTGRLLLAREGYPLDHERVIEACAEHDVAIELNANPYRLDLDWRWLRAATDHGVLISVNPDAHSPDELRNVTWGVTVGRKGWLEPSQTLNAKSLSAFQAWLAEPTGA
ncbi:MAG: helix-hairpin-helix domain-containing protein [Salinibacter sp.]